MKATKLSKLESKRLEKYEKLLPYRQRLCCYLLNNELQLSKLLITRMDDLKYGEEQRKSFKTTYQQFTTLMEDWRRTTESSRSVEKVWDKVERQLSRVYRIDSHSSDSSDSCDSPGRSEVKQVRGSRSRSNSVSIGTETTTIDEDEFTNTESSDEDLLQNDEVTCSKTLTEMLLSSSGEQTRVRQPRHRSNSQPTRKSATLEEPQLSQDSKAIVIKCSTQRGRSKSKSVKIRSSDSLTYDSLVKTLHHKLHMSSSKPLSLSYRLKDDHADVRAATTTTRVDPVGMIPISDEDSFAEFLSKSVNDSHTTKGVYQLWFDVS